jgi:hypothetical protein
VGKCSLQSGKAANFDNYYQDKYVELKRARCVYYVANEIFHNIRGSSVDKRPAASKWPQDFRPEGMNNPTSWLKLYKDVVSHHYPRTSVDGMMCAAATCKREATCGGHVRFDKAEGCFLVPLCRTHNNYSRDDSKYRCNTDFAVKVYYSKAEVYENDDLEDLTLKLHGVHIR